MAFQNDYEPAFGVGGTNMLDYPEFPFVDAWSQSQDFQTLDGTAGAGSNQSSKGYLEISLALKFSEEILSVWFFAKRQPCDLPIFSVPNGWIFKSKLL